MTIQPKIIERLKYYGFNRPDRMKIADVKKTNQMLLDYATGAANHKTLLASLIAIADKYRQPINLSLICRIREDIAAHKTVKKVEKISWNAQASIAFSDRSEKPKVTKQPLQRSQAIAANFNERKSFLEDKEQNQSLCTCSKCDESAKSLIELKKFFDIDSISGIKVVNICLDCE